MGVIGISEQDQDAIFCTLAAILHLGNIEFLEKGDSVSIASNDHIAIVAQLLNVQEERLAQVVDNHHHHTQTKKNKQEESSLCVCACLSLSLSLSLYIYIYPILIIKVEY